MGPYVSLTNVLYVWIIQEFLSTPLPTSISILAVGPQTLVSQISYTPNSYKYFSTLSHLLQLCYKTYGIKLTIMKIENLALQWVQLVFVTNSSSYFQSSKYVIWHFWHTNVKSKEIPLFISFNMTTQLP